MPVEERAERIAADIAHLAVPIDSLSPHPDNPREGDVGAIVVSLETFEQYKPIVFQKSRRHILAGNHTWRAARSLGWATIAAVGVDVDDERARALMLADNRIGELGSYDEAALLELAKALPDDLLAATGYDAEALDELARAIAPAPTDFLDRYLEQLPEGEEDAGDEVDEHGFVQFAVAMTPQQRARAQTALQRAKAVAAVATTAEALVAVAEDYLERHP